MKQKKCIYLNPSLADELADFAKRHGFVQSILVENAVKAHLESLNKGFLLAADIRSEKKKYA